MENLKRQVLLYPPKKSDWIILIEGIGILLLFGWFFYRSFWASLILLPMLIPFYINAKRKAEEKYRHNLGIEFRDAILSVSTSAKAGYSMENAFVYSYKDMKQLYGASSAICKELSRIEKGLRNNVVLEKLLYDLGERSRSADIREFASVFTVAKRSGGNMTEIMSNTIDLIGDRMDIEKEIDVLISAKRMEARIMEIVPFGIVFYVGLANPGFFDPLYHNLPGILLMTICMLVYVTGFFMIEKIIEIKV